MGGIAVVHIRVGYLVDLPVLPHETYRIQQRVISIRTLQLELRQPCLKRLSS